MSVHVVAVCAVLAAFVSLAPVTGRAQPLFKCGAAYQDRPCPSEDVQKRFSATTGTFSIGQVNPDTDRDCAKFAAEALPFWKRMNGGEPFEALKAEVDSRSISRYDKGQMRDALTALRQYKGTPRDVQSQLETQCMNHKRMRGLPTERDTANVTKAREARVAEAESRSRSGHDRAEEARLLSEESRVAREDQARARAAALAAAVAARAAARPAPEKIVNRGGNQ